MLLALCLGLGARANGQRAEERPTLIERADCDVDEHACPGGVLVDDQCWRVGGRGQSCAQVCGMEAMVDVERTIDGSARHQVIDCLEDVKMPDLRERACPPSSDIGLDTE
jgi:hypothetical protein